DDLMPKYLTKPYLCFDSAFFFGVAVLIDNAVNPGSPYFAHRAVGENSRVFERNIPLIIEAISHPAAQCFRREPAFVHGDVERMFIVVSPGADRSQIFDESFAVPKPGGHRPISNPSRAISILAYYSCAPSGVPVQRIGFVLFMCV